MAQQDNTPDWKIDFPYSTVETLQVSRRQFAKFLCLVSGGLMAGSGLVAIKSSFFPERKVEGEHFVCNTAALPVGGTRSFTLPGSTVPYILIHLENDEWRAYEQKCTHLSCAVFYKPGTGRIECPCHNGWFDALTGEVVQGPPPRPLPALNVIVKGDAVYVTGQQPA
ncbi:MAG TPA: Rieske (2Fe-2S) protein [Chitinophaga sp.]|jgi:Rieske Fe-S protein|uniref:Rieske (2Fe-2S) protein n=1 Tax=Chitinophaga sp. TaxID=1869181 RepID=UPI002DB65857|nr:Rieske (2Fe-2S) protein [Chitinophaga sp.]HEU4551569.1 Rieske (2Fe-2S) protein [Chitinophaga sp.]